ncbi:hypothetical protein B0H14DRAFT_3439802 [Mycena olivaceomarginata]|nr:hypothetical protein B0H14DRAFT_3439802 [Mycena olivaceomarginata]
MLIAASSSVGLAPLLIASGQFIASTAHTMFAPTAVLALSGTVNYCMVIHALKRLSPVIMAVALTTCFSAGGVNVGQ